MLGSQAQENIHGVYQSLQPELLKLDEDYWIGTDFGV
jgi:hypothetical protein